MNKLKSDPKKLSLKCKRYKCSLDREYLLQMLTAIKLHAVALGHPMTASALFQ